MQDEQPENIIPFDHLYFVVEISEDVTGEYPGLVFVSPIDIHAYCFRVYIEERTVPPAPKSLHAAESSVYIVGYKPFHPFAGAGAFSAVQDFKTFSHCLPPVLLVPNGGMSQGLVWRLCLIIRNPQTTAVR